MAQVPYSEGVPSVSPQTSVPPDYLSVPTRPGEFGAHIAQGLEQAGAGAVKAGQFFGEVAADQATNNWQDQTADIIRDFRNKRGQDAVEAWPAVQDQLKQALASHRDSLSTPASQLLFDQQTRYLYSRELQNAGAHYDDQQRTWATDVNNSGVTNALRHISDNPDDPDAVRAATGDVIRAMVRNQQLQGNANDPQVLENTLSTARQRALEAQIAALEPTNPTRALEIFNDPANRGLLAGSPHYDTLAARLQNQADKRAGHDAAISAWGGTGLPLPGPDSGDIWSRIKQQERGVGAAGEALISPKGAVGISQILPETARGVAGSLGVPYDERRLHTDQVYNEQLGQEYLRQQLSRYGGNPVLASAAYNAGPERVDQWITKFGDPRTGAISNEDFAGKIPIAETRNYVRAVAVSGAPATGAPTAGAPVGGRGFPTREELIGRIPEGLSDSAYGHAYSEVNRLYTHFEQATSATRAATRQSIRNGIPMLEDGRDFAYSENQIRSVLPGPEADQALDLLADARAVGQQKTAVRGMSMTEALNQSAANRAALTNAPATEYTKMRKMADAFEKAAAEHFKELFADPAGYIAATNPEIERLRQGIGAETPEIAGALRAAGQPTAFEKYAAALTDEQARLGVPPESQHVLSTASAPGLAQGIMADPSRAPSKIRQMQQGYGSAWPAVWNDLTTIGKMPTGYQALGVLDEANAEQLARGLGAGKEGKAWDTLIGASTKNDIAKALRGDDGVQRLLTSLRTEGASPGQIADFLGAINTLGFTKQMEGDTSAAANAAKAFTDLYQFMPNGGARVPAKLFDAVSANARATLDGLNPENLTIPPAFGTLQPKSGPGMIAQGNIDLEHRPNVRNPDGRTSTVLSTSVEIDGNEVLIPRVAADGSRILSVDEAVEQYRRTGQQLGIFDTPEHATAYAERLHEAQAANLGRQPGTPNADDYVRLIQSAPSWVNAQGDALVLMGGSPLSRIVRDKDGNPITVKFGTPASTPNQPQTMPTPPFSGF